MKIFILLMMMLFSSCKSNQTTKTVVDPWHGTFLHSSGEFTLSLKHFGEEVVDAEFFAKGKKRPVAFFFADIQGDTAIFKDRTDPRCKLILKIAELGIDVSDQCHGTGEIDGSYKRIGDKI